MQGHQEQIRILAVDDHPVLRDGIGALIANHADLMLVAEASNGRQAIEMYRLHRPNVTLMDLQMPDMDGIETIASIRAEFPAARIVVLTMFAGDVLAQRALKAGACAYVLKGLVRKELLETIRAAHSGQKRIDPQVAANIAQNVSGGALTRREVEVLRLVADGLSNMEIAARLHIDDETAKGHMRNILAKLEANDRTHAVTIGLRRGIISL